MKKLILIFALLSLLFASLAAVADDSKISPDLQGYKSTQQVQVIVQYAPGTNISCSGLLGLLGCVVGDVLKLGGTILGDLPLVNGLVATLDSNGIAQLSNNSNVLYISRDRHVSTLSSGTEAVAINASTAWKSGYTGTGIGVALIDSGVNSHRDLNGLLFSRVVYNQSFLSGTYNAADQYGHGMHIAGLIAGNGASSTGRQYSQTFTGIAPNAKIVNLRVLDANGAGTDSAVINAISRAIALKSTYNIRVINLSLGRAVYESYKLDPLCQAVERAWKNGIVVVVAAGNYGRFVPTDGYATVTSPGNDPYVLTVGAMKTMDTPQRDDDLIASYSSKGPTLLDHVVKPDIVAPGNLLISTETSNTTLYANETNNLVPNNAYIYGGSSAPSTSYFALSGTSMAAGVVSGAVADLLQAQPWLTPDQVKARLMKTASKTFPETSSVYDPTTGNTYTSQYDVFTVGAGYLDLAAALADRTIASGTAMSPIAVVNPNSGNVTLSRDRSSVWGTSSTWSSNSVWGPARFAATSSASWSTAPLWGSTVMWGAGGTSGFGTIWSDTVMWGTSGDSGTTVMWGANGNAGSTVMWGASGDCGSTVMWGASGNCGSTVMWGASTDGGE